jgi:hypothetical protein
LIKDKQGNTSKPDVSPEWFADIASEKQVVSGGLPSSPQIQQVRQCTARTIDMIVAIEPCSGTGVCAVLAPQGSLPYHMVIVTYRSQRLLHTPDEVEGRLQVTNL